MEERKNICKKMQKKKNFKEVFINFLKILIARQFMIRKKINSNTFNQSINQIDYSINNDVIRRRDKSFVPMEYFFFI